MDKPRGNYKCGKCGDMGHNARTCPTKVAKVEPVVAPTPVAESGWVLTGTKVVETPPVPPVAQVPLSTSDDFTHRPIEVSTRPARPPSPYDCPTCKCVGILVLVELIDGTPQLRCEHCHNKVACRVIMKWGAAPLDKPANNNVRVR
ncbi:MAG: hypothetical protein MN733_30250 [Nitrososphaera sp.]|nr:hypothetical protein [Nitrososphaera sp.]